MGRVENKQGFSAEIIVDTLIFSVQISKRIQVWSGKPKVVVEIHNPLCGVRKTYILI